MPPPTVMFTIAAASPNVPITRTSDSGACIAAGEDVDFD